MLWWQLPEVRPVRWVNVYTETEMSLFWRKFCHKLHGNELFDNLQCSQWQFRQSANRFSLNIYKLTVATDEIVVTGGMIIVIYSIQYPQVFFLRVLQRLYHQFADDSCNLFSYIRHCCLFNTDWCIIDRLPRKWPGKNEINKQKRTQSSEWIVDIILAIYHNMMASSNGNIFRVTGLLCGEFIGHRWIPRTKASDVELWCFL